MKSIIYYIYIIRCSNNYLYTGITTDLERRFNEHKKDHKKGAKFTRANPPLKVEIVWETTSRSTASKLECALKKLTKTEKENLISKNSTLSLLFGEKFNDCLLLT